MFLLNIVLFLTIISLYLLAPTNAVLFSGCKFCQKFGLPSGSMQRTVFIVIISCILSLLLHVFVVIKSRKLKSARSIKPKSLFFHLRIIPGKIFFERHKNLASQKSRLSIAVENAYAFY